MRVIIAGAGGALGADVARHVEAAGGVPIRTARRAAAGNRPLDLGDEAAVRAAARGADGAVLCPILTVSAPAARWMAEEGVRRIVVFSSNNVAIDPEAAVYERLRAAETRLSGLDADITILRPTMIYGHAGDGNLSRLMRFAQRFSFLPCPGSGRALQQPVFIGDVARAAAEEVLRQGGGTYAVGGPDVIANAELFAAVLRAAGKSPRAVASVPLAPLRAAAHLAQRTSLPFPVTPAQLARIECDKTAVGAAPPGFAAHTGLEEGLARLARSLAAPGGQG